LRQLIGLLVLLITVDAPNRSADAAWLQCVATGKAVAGMQTAYLTSVVPLPAGHKQQPNYFRQLLQRYVATQYPDSRDLTVACTNDDDQLHANSRYDTTYSETARRVGWENTHVILPGDWLPKDWLTNGDSAP
jgi:hypothetical protein